MIINTIISVVITFIVSGALGYCLNSLKSYKKKEVATEMALLTLLQSNLTNTYFKYERKRQIPDYVYKNWLNELNVYEKLGGNDYVHILAKKMEAWEIIFDKSTS